MLTDRFSDALVYATVLHRTQTRKATFVPYVSHLLSVTALVLEHGGDEDQAIAGLLHDGPEDQGGEDTLAEITERFGERVGTLVSQCSEPLEFAGHPWRERKMRYLAHLKTIDADAVLVTCADKLHNVRSIVSELRDTGLEVFDRFNGGLEGSLWYYAALADAFEEIGPASISRDLREVVDRMIDLAADMRPASA
jgi:(p)ppGpp synthase/HD superfamily hydrolase